MNKDQVKGRVDELKGTIQEVAGNVTGDKDLAQTGKRKRAKGKVQSGLGDLKADLKKIIDGI